MKDISKGFIALYRQFLEWEWYDDANTMRVFIHCLLLANYAEKKWRGKTINRGQFITSQSKLANSLKLSIKQIRGSLTKLKTTGELAVQTTPEYSIITVKNYDFYQDEGRQKGRQETEKGQTKGRRRATTNKDNKRDINKLISLSIEERENLKKYILAKKKNVKDVDAYIRKLLDNGDVTIFLGKAKKWVEKQAEKGKVKNEVKTEVTESDEECKEAMKRAREKINKLRKGK